MARMRGKDCLENVFYYGTKSIKLEDLQINYAYRDIDFGSAFPKLPEYDPSIGWSKLNSQLNEKNFLHQRMKELLNKIETLMKKKDKDRELSQYFLDIFRMLRPIHVNHAMRINKFIIENMETVTHENITMLRGPTGIGKSLLVQCISNSTMGFCREDKPNSLVFVCATKYANPRLERFQSRPGSTSTTKDIGIVNITYNGKGHTVVDVPGDGDTEGAAVELGQQAAKLNIVQKRGIRVLGMITLEYQKNHDRLVEQLQSIIDFYGSDMSVDDLTRWYPSLIPIYNFKNTEQGVIRTNNMSEVLISNLAEVREEHCKKYLYECNTIKMGKLLDLMIESAIRNPPFIFDPMNTKERDRLLNYFYTHENYFKEFQSGFSASAKAWLAIEEFAQRSYSNVKHGWETFNTELVVFTMKDFNQLVSLSNGKEPKMQGHYTVRKDWIVEESSHDYHVATAQFATEFRQLNKLSNDFLTMFEKKIDFLDAVASEFQTHFPDMINFKYTHPKENCTRFINSIISERMITLRQSAVASPEQTDFVDKLLRLNRNEEYLQYMDELLNRFEKMGEFPLEESQWNYLTDDNSNQLLQVFRNISKGLVEMRQSFQRGSVFASHQQDRANAILQKISTQLTNWMNSTVRFVKKMSKQLLIMPPDENQLSSSFMSPPSPIATLVKSVEYFLTQLQVADVNKLEGALAVRKQMLEYLVQFMTTLYDKFRIVDWNAFDCSSFHYLTKFLSLYEIQELKGSTSDMYLSLMNSLTRITTSSADVYEMFSSAIERFSSIYSTSVVIDDLPMNKLHSKIKEINLMRMCVGNHTVPKATVYVIQELNMTMMKLLDKKNDSLQNIMERIPMRRPRELTAWFKEFNNKRKEIAILMVFDRNSLPEIRLRAESIVKQSIAVQSDLIQSIRSKFNLSSHHVLNVLEEITKCEIIRREVDGLHPKYLFWIDKEYSDRIELNETISDLTKRNASDMIEIDAAIQKIDKKIRTLGSSDEDEDRKIDLYAEKKLKRKEKTDLETRYQDSLTGLRRLEVQYEVALEIENGQGEKQIEKVNKEGYPTYEDLLSRMESLKGVSNESETRKKYGVSFEYFFPLTLSWDAMDGYYTFLNDMMTSNEVNPSDQVKMDGQDGLNDMRFFFEKLIEEFESQFKLFKKYLESGLQNDMYLNDETEASKWDVRMKTFQNLLQQLYDHREKRCVKESIPSIDAMGRDVYQYLSKIKIRIEESSQSKELLPWVDSLKSFDMLTCSDWYPDNAISFRELYRKLMEKNSNAIQLKVAECDYSDASEIIRSHSHIRGSDLVNSTLAESTVHLKNMNSKVSTRIIMIHPNLPIDQFKVEFNELLKSIGCISKMVDTEPLYSKLVEVLPSVQKEKLQKDNLQHSLQKAVDSVIVTIIRTFQESIRERQFHDAENAYNRLKYVSDSLRPELSSPGLLSSYWSNVAAKINSDVYKPWTNLANDLISEMYKTTAWNCTYDIKSLLETLKSYKPQSPVFISVLNHWNQKFSNAINENLSPLQLTSLRNSADKCLLNDQAQEIKSTLSTLEARFQRETAELLAVVVKTLGKLNGEEVFLKDFLDLRDLWNEVTTKDVPEVVKRELQGKTFQLFDELKDECFKAIHRNLYDWRLFKVFQKLFTFVHATGSILMGVEETMTRLQSKFKDVFHAEMNSITTTVSSSSVRDKEAAFEKSFEFVARALCFDGLTERVVCKNRHDIVIHTADKGSSLQDTRMNMDGSLDSSSDEDTPSEPSNRTYFLLSKLDIEEGSNLLIKLQQNWIANQKKFDLAIISGIVPDLESALDYAIQWKFLKDLLSVFAPSSAAISQDINDLSKWTPQIVEHINSLLSSITDTLSNHRLEDETAVPDLLLYVRKLFSLLKITQLTHLINIQEVHDKLRKLLNNAVDSLNRRLNTDLIDNWTTLPDEDTCKLHSKFIADVFDLPMKLNSLPDESVLENLRQVIKTAREKVKNIVTKYSKSVNVIDKTEQEYDLIAEQLMKLKPLSVHFRPFRYDVDEAIDVKLDEFLDLYGLNGVDRLGKRLSRSRMGGRIFNEHMVFSNMHLLAFLQNTKEQDQQSYIMRELHPHPDNVKVLSEWLDQFNTVFYTANKKYCDENSYDGLLQEIDDSVANPDQFVKSIALISTLWSCLKSKKHRTTLKANKDQIVVLKPLAPQQVAIISSLGYDFSKKIQKNYLSRLIGDMEYPPNTKNGITQVHTGGGKSLIIAVTAAYLSKQKKKTVDVLTFGENLRDRDRDSFAEFYELLKISGKVNYKTFAQATEDSLNEATNLRYEVESIILDGIEPTKKDATAKTDRNKICIIDEADTIINSYARLYSANILLKRDEIFKLLSEIWEKKKATGPSSLQEVTAFDSYKVIVGSKLNAWISIIRQQIASALNELSTYNPSEVLHFSEDGKIVYTSGDSKVDNIYKGYQTVWDYFRAYDESTPVTQEVLKQSVGLLVSAGRYSFIELLDQYSYITAVTGTFTTRSKTDQELLKESLQLERITVMPEIFVRPKEIKIFDPNNDVQIVEEAKYFPSLFQEIQNEIINRRDKPRAVVIFFENEQKLNTFLMSTYMKDHSGEVNILDESLGKEIREERILKASDVGTVTLATAIYMRGTDFINIRVLIENGGMHVVGAFLPDDHSQIVQMMGRTGRMGEVGSFKFILLDSDLEWLLGLEWKSEVKRLLDDRLTLYDNLIAKVNSIDETVCAEKKLDKLNSMTVHKMSMELLDAIRQGQMNDIRQGLNNLNLGSGSNSVKRYRYVIALDNTGSMNPIISQLQSIILTVLERLGVILDEEGFNKENIMLQIVLYNDYDCKWEEMLVASPFETSYDGLADFVKTHSEISYCGGNVDLPEAVEVVLKHMVTIADESPDDIVQLILITDAPAKDLKAIMKSRKVHGEAYWLPILGPAESVIELMPKLIERQIKCMTFYSRSSVELQEAIQSLQSIAKQTGGLYNALPMHNEIEGVYQLIKAINVNVLRDIAGESAVNRYLEKFKDVANV